MNDFQKLDRFPLGSIKATGFLREQLLRNKDGMGGHLDEIEPEMIATPYIDTEEFVDWHSSDQYGWGAEISGNYWAGLIQLAFTLNDDALIKKATDWVDKVLQTQLNNGYLGTYRHPNANMYEDFNAWGTSCGMRALLAFYEATGREDVLNAVYRCMLWFCEHWAGDKKTVYGGQLITEAMIFCYKYKKDQRLIDFCVEYADFICRKNFFHCSYKSFLNEELKFNSNHTAAYGTNSRLPGLLYSVTGNEDYLKASERIIQQIRQKAMHLSGSPVSVNEWLGPVGSTTETEYCSYAFFNASYSYMSYITGEAKYGDYMEEMFYNGAQGARKKDERAIAYLSAPNQIYASDKSSSTYNDMQIYSPCYPVSCCPVNSVAVLPEFVRGMMLKDRENNIYMTAYGPCRLEADGVVIEERTMYPFRNNILFQVKADKEFSIFLKIPQWARDYRITLNGKDISVKSVKNGYAEIRKKWTTDTIEIKFESEIEVIRVDDSYASKKYPLAIRRGVLLYSLPIPTVWLEVPFKRNIESNYCKLPDGWYCYNAKPVFEEADVPDFHEQLGLRKYQTSWNVALDENLKAEDITVEENDVDGYVWENPQIKLKLKAYRAPFLCAPYPERTFEPFGDKQTVDGEVNIELVPYGCTNLRITYFPIADLNK